MPEFEFTLAISGGLNEDRLNALFEAGCDDMTFSGAEAGPSYAEVVREGESFVETVVNAIHQVESAGGLRVDALDSAELVSMSDIAERLGRTRESVRLLVEGRRGPGHFPAPAVRVSDRTKLWAWSEVVEWLNTAYGMNEPGPTTVADVVNAALALRRGEEHLSEGDREALRELVAH